MAFIIRKKSSKNGRVRELYYLVESYREGKKVKRRKILDLHQCKSLAEFLQYTQQQEKQITYWLTKYQKDWEHLAQTGRLPSSSVGSGYVSVRVIKGNIKRFKAQLKVCQDRMDVIKRYVVPETL